MKLVFCPVEGCGYSVDLGKEEHGLVMHLQVAHERESLKYVHRLLADAENIDEMEPNELRLYIENLCRNESAVKWLSRLRSSIEEGYV